VSQELFMSIQLEDRITQFRKMATDDPDNELGHYRLGQLLMEAGRYDEALQAFRRTLELSPQFSKVYQLEGDCLIRLDRRVEAVKLLREGFAVADERGDNMPRDEMARMLTGLGEEAPTPKKPTSSGGGGEGFRCQRPGCMSGSRARRLAGPPMSDELGQRIYESICADCWNDWLRNYSIKVINEMRLDLSLERGQEIYDQVMKDFLFGESERGVGSW
jgi:Fe-S cluster biosynthesis and repair protein YggX